MVALGYSRCLFYFAMFICSSMAFEVLYPPHLEGFYRSPWLSRYGPETPPTEIIGRLVSSFTDAAGPVEGNIVLGCEAGFERTAELNADTPKDISVKITDSAMSLMLILKDGAKRDQVYEPRGSGLYELCPVFKYETVPGILNHLIDGSDISNITIPAWDTAFMDIKPILAYFRSGEENITVIVRMGFSDQNEWDEMYATLAFYPYSIIVGLYAMAAVIFATTKLVMYLRVKGPELSIPQTCFWIEIVANLVRLIYHGIDPIWCRKLYPQAAGNILLTLTFPVFATTTLLITFYWKELLEAKKMKVVTFINRMKWPFIAAAFVFWGAELAASFCRGFGVGPVATLTIIASVVYIVCILFTSILFFFYGNKVLKLAKARQANVQKASKFKAIKLLIASGVLSLFYVLLLIFNATPFLFLPWGFFAGNLINVLLLITISMVQIAAFAPPDSGSRSSSNQGKRLTPIQESTPMASQAAGPSTFRSEQIVTPVLEDPNSIDIESGRSKSISSHSEHDSDERSGSEQQSNAISSGQQSSSVSKSSSADSS